MARVTGLYSSPASSKARTVTVPASSLVFTIRTNPCRVPEAAAGKSHSRRAPPPAGARVTVTR